ncbi:MAG: hypothetical protein HC927_05970 [Deltaproteobacteria bacterium]|nr:hypothetical protein [Deltaproteobacteria bacterium]
MTYKNTLHKTLPALPQRKRVAFAAACAERVRSLFETETEEDRDWFFDAIVFLWKFAYGHDISAEMIADMRAKVESFYDDLMEVEDYGYDASAVQCLRAALNAIHDPTTRSAKNAAAFAIDVAGLSSIRDEHIKLAQTEEETFQMKVLEVLRQWPGETIRMRTFKPVGWTDDDGWPDPQWFERLENDPSW